LAELTVSTGSRRFASTGRGSDIGDEVVETVIGGTLATAPPDATHSSTRGLAANHGISHVAGLTHRSLWADVRRDPRPHLARLNE
jgi:hypothetical protein